jgi:hypothetical protein
MISIDVPDSMAPAIERLVDKLIKFGLDKLTWGEYLDKGEIYAKREIASLSSRPGSDNSDIALTDKLRVVLQLSGEAFLSPSGLEVSDRVLSWCLNALAKQGGMTHEEAQKCLDSYSDGDRFWSFMQLLDDPALSALIQILERESKSRKTSEVKTRLSA